MQPGAQIVDPTTPPDQRRTPAPMPSCIGRVLNVLHKLIDYGRQLADTLQLRAAAPNFAIFAKPFGTTDLAAIIARITGGLRRAAQLEARLCRLAARGQDLAPASIRAPAIPGQRPARRAAPREPRRTDPAQDSRLARLPTEQEIAAEVLRRPVGAVIVDICRDLGIMPGDLDRAFWDELSAAIMAHGGSLAGFLLDLNRRMFALDAGRPAGPAAPGWSAPPPRLPALATGPP
jgi:hypothetical protein